MRRAVRSALDATHTTRSTKMESKQYEYAGFWARTGATIIDTILLLLITTPLLVSIYGWSYYTNESYGLIAGPADFLISWVIPAIAVSYTRKNGYFFENRRRHYWQPCKPSTVNWPLFCLLHLSNSALPWNHLGRIRQTKTRVA